LFDGLESPGAFEGGAIGEEAEGGVTVGALSGTFEDEVGFSLALLVVLFNASRTTCAKAGWPFEVVALLRFVENGEDSDALAGEAGLELETMLSIRSN
jgi:hypothetical protein